MLARHVLLVLCVVAAPATAVAEVNVWEKDGSYLDIAMLLQIQGRFVKSDGAGVTPDGSAIFFRRIRPAISGSVDHDWYGIIEIDFGLGYEGQDPRTSIQLAFIAYDGFQDSHATAVAIGSMKAAFGQEFLTPSTKVLTLERTFSADQWYGTPDLAMGAGFAYANSARTLATQVVGGMMSIRQRPDRIWFQNPQNQSDPDDDTGILVSGRVEYWPFGEMPVRPKHPSRLAFDPNDLARTEEWRLLANVGGFGWWNNNSNHITTECPVTDSHVCPDGLVDVRRVVGGELSSTLLGYGFVAQAEYQHIRGTLRESTFDGGLYRNGKTVLDKLTLNGGYMVVANTLELWGSFSFLSATNFPGTWYSTRGGLHWFAHKHSVQFSLELTRNTNAFGTQDAYENIARVEAQLAW